MTDPNTMIREVCEDIYEHTTQEHAYVLTALVNYSADCRQILRGSTSEDELQHCNQVITVLERLIKEWR